jgi:hypothetical protein
MAIHLDIFYSLHPRMICSKFIEIGLLVLEKKIFLNINMVFPVMAPHEPKRP